jgi:hypothetical protein
MRETCHRCGGELPAGTGESPFCPHCGAPQIYLSLDYQSPETGGEPREVVADPSDSNVGVTARRRQVDWKAAIQCASIVAGIAGALSLGAARVELLSTLSTLWIMSGSLITLGLYQRRRPLAWMDAGLGARIGLLVGLCLAAALGTAGAVVGLVARFGRHAMGNFDTEAVTTIQKAINQSATPIPPDVAGMMFSPEFRAGLFLMGCACVGVFLLALSTLGGAFAGLLRTRRKPAL